MGIEEKIDVYNDRLKVAEQRLARNWTLQVILIVISILSFFGPGLSLAPAAEQNFGLDLHVDPRVAGLIIAILLIYQFMLFGFLVNTFGNLRDACDIILDRNLTPEEQKLPVHRLFETGNFFEPLVNRDLQDARIFPRFVLAIMIVVAMLGHACVLIHLHRAFGLIPTLILGFGLGLFLHRFYVAFLRSPLGQRHGVVKSLAWIPLVGALLMYVAYITFWL